MTGERNKVSKNGKQVTKVKKPKPRNWKPRKSEDGAQHLHLSRAPGESNVR
jgi:hypothetical protein